MSSQNVEIVRGSFDGWNRGDFDAWLEGAHPEIEWSSAIVRRVEGAEAVYRGMDGMRRYWDEWHAVWEVTIEILEIRDLGDTVLALGRIRTRGEASGIDLERPENLDTIVRVQDVRVGDRTPVDRARQRPLGYCRKLLQQA